MTFVRSNSKANISIMGVCIHVSFEFYHIDSINWYGNLLVFEICNGVGAPVGITCCGLLLTFVACLQLGPCQSGVRNILLVIVPYFWYGAPRSEATAFVLIFVGYLQLERCRSGAIGLYYCMFGSESNCLNKFRLLLLIIMIRSNLYLSRKLGLLLAND